MHAHQRSWSSAIKPDSPAGDAAVTMLRKRLRDVARLLPKAAEEKPGSAKSVEHVHALRVATRRAEATVAVFRDAMRPKDLEKVCKALRKIRRAAGTARDLDVQLKILGAAARSANARTKAALEELSKRTRSQRRAAHKPLEKVADRWPARQLRDRWDRVADHTAGWADATMLEVAQKAVARARAGVERAAAADLHVVDHVHELRIRLKRLRYAVEAVKVCFGDAWKRRIEPHLSAVQTSLGEINDAHVLVTRLAADEQASGTKATRSTDRGSSASRALAELSRQQSAALARAHAAFLEQWGRLVASGFLRQIEAHLAPEPPTAKAPASKARPAPAAIVEPKPAAMNGVHRSPGRRRVAAIDVGTNSIRLIVAEAHADGSYRVLDDEKEITRLGKGLAATGKLDPATIEHSVETIARMASIARGYGASEIQVVGTSAAREASNASRLVAGIRSRTGLELRVVSGEDEAQLAYRSAANAFNLTGISAAVIDIGGGSTEVVMSAAHPGAGPSGPAGAPGGVIERIYSMPLGAVRLTDHFGGPEACAGRRFEEMRKHIKRTLRDTIGRPPFVPQLAIGTGGTLTTLAAMVAQRELGASAEGLFSGSSQGMEVGRADLKHLLEYLRKLPVKERARVPGLSADRADIIVAGLAIIDGALKHLGVNRVRVHEGGIRDGILLDMVGGQGGAAAAAAKRDPMRAVRRFAKSCEYEAAHARHVTMLALRIFDQLRDQKEQLKSSVALDFGPEQRLLLEAASLLHDVGYLINYAQHHKHSYHLITHADLPGLTADQVRIIANVARYHRAAEPKARHQAFAMLSEHDREVVRGLSAVLRIADGLDRTHMQSVTGVDVRLERAGAVFQVRAECEPAVDVWGAARKSQLFQQFFRMLPHFEWVKMGKPARSGTPADGVTA